MACQQGGRRIKCSISPICLLQERQICTVLKHIKMKYLTHIVLFQLSREVKPERGRRDPFGLDAASCWCFALACPSSTSAAPSSHAKSRNIQHHLTCADIELEYLTPAGKSRVTVPEQVTSEVAAQPTWQTQMLPRRPPTAHCRPQSKHRNSLNNPHSSPYQSSPRSK
jgi:hypothetical protein